MLIKDDVISGVLARLADHYNTNLSTRFIRPLTLPVFTDDEMAQKIAALTELTETYIAQGVYLDDLYAQILAMARYVYLVRKDIIPNLRNNAGNVGPNDANKVFRDMAMSNLAANISVLADLVYELYERAVRVDELQNAKKRPVYRDYPGVNELSRYLGKQ
ncbi:MAG TPA: hypothetical protein PKH40_07170 [Treponemataceae bacterium]|jgi:hypothetical protein|nr:MAG: hypothetical protein BWY39_00972 [Spirochaetes bacterium ADurb.Bin269]TAH54310.1 MAG: hypothetical protein EWM51_07270 [Treponema sp.]HOC29443.1 hypothetical protein [Treponemataceae bacterium]HQL33351.1 hypothetical protein [Treponemataceae bacterium]